MRSRQILVAAGLTLLTVGAGLLAWEYSIEDMVKASFFPGYPSDSAGERWQTIEIGLGVALIAALVPIWLALRLAAKHRRAERELTLARERIEAIAANPDWLWEADENGVYTYASPKIRELLGYEPEDVIGKTPFDLMPSDEVARIADELAAIVAERRPFAFLEHTHLRKDGRLAVIETSGVPIHDKHGVFKGYRGIDRDVTERKAMERRLAEQKALLEAAFEAIPDAIATTDPDRRLIAVNRGFAEAFGWMPKEVVGQSPSMFYESQDEFRRQGELRYNPLADGPSPPYIVRYRRRNGEIFPAEVRGAPIRDAAGFKIGYLAVIRDVTERLAMECRLREVRKMEAIGQLTAGIAHDYNNLLQVIQGNLDLAHHLVGSNQPIACMLTNAIEASRRGARITQQLLSFGRRDILCTRAVAVAPLVEGLRGLLRKRLGDAIRIVTDLATDLPPIAVDPHTLETALLHVVDNARAAMPDGGTLTIRATERRLDSDLAIEDGKLSAGTYVEIAITDTGCGMSERVREKAFEPFFTTHAPSESSGLGLSVVQGFARQSGGHAALASALGKGTTVTLLMPVAAARDASGSDD